MIARVVPRFPGSITGALLAERWGIRRVSTWLVTLQFFSTGLLTVIFLGGGRILLWTVLVLVVFSQFGNGGVRPLLTSGLHSISGEEKYAKGLSLYNAGAGVGMVGGPVLGALLLVKSSAGIVLMCDTASFLVLILGLVCIPLGRKAEKTVWKEGVATIQRMWIQKDLKFLVIGFFASFFMVTGVQAVLPTLTAIKFGDGTALGILYSFIGLGGVVGAFTSA